MNMKREMGRQTEGWWGWGGGGGGIREAEFVNLKRKEKKKKDISKHQSGYKLL